MHPLIIVAGLVVLMALRAKSATAAEVSDEDAATAALLARQTATIAWPPAVGFTVAPAAVPAGVAVVDPLSEAAAADPLRPDELDPELDPDPTVRPRGQVLRFRTPAGSPAGPLAAARARRVARGDDGRQFDGAHLRSWLASPAAARVSPRIRAAVDNIAARLAERAAERG